MTQIAPVITNSAGAATNTVAKASASSANDEFSRVLSESMLQTMTGSILSGMSGGSGSGGFSAMPLDSGMSYLQTSLAAQAGEGEVSQDNMLMFMMMMMMQEFKDSDLTPLMGAMMSSLGTAAGSGGGSVATKPSILGYQTAAISSAIVPKEAWRPTTARVESEAGDRSADQLRKVLDQFNVESAERYTPYRNGNTYCNIFVWDATSALNCEIPHYVDRATGEPRSYPNTSGAYELDANGTHDWLAKNGANYGWHEVSAAEAQAYANAGYPAVSAWKSSGGTAGHVQMVCPSKDGGYDEQRGVTVAQAGSRNFNYAHINATMSKDKIADTRYFVHA